MPAGLSALETIGNAPWLGLDFLARTDGDRHVGRRRCALNTWLRPDGLGDLEGSLSRLASGSGYQRGNRGKHLFDLDAAVPWPPRAQVGGLQMAECERNGSRGDEDRNQRRRIPIVTEGRFVPHQGRSDGVR
jgi:hypothetical protein